MRCPHGYSSGEWWQVGSDPVDSCYIATPCEQCAAEEHAAWVESVAAKLRAALAAAVAGEPFTWHTWLPTDEQQLADAAAAEFGRDPWVARTEPYDPARDGEPVERLPLFEEFQGADAYSAAMEPLTVEQINALLYELEESKPMLACAPGMYERVRDAVAGGELAGRVRVREHPWLTGDQVYLVDPAAFTLPSMSEMFAADPDAFKPKFICPTCLRPAHEPNYCLWCELFREAIRKASPPPPISFLGLLGGLG